MFGAAVLSFQVSKQGKIEEIRLLEKRKVYNNSFQHVGGDTFVYTSFWDDRMNDFDNKNGKLSHIRIMAIAPHERQPDLLCIFNIRGVKIKVKVEYKVMFDRHELDYEGFVLNCQVPDGLQYQSGFNIQISNKILNPVTLHVHKIPNKHPSIDFGVCIQPLYGDIDRNRLIQFIEMSQILGAQKIVFYTQNIKPDIYNILKFYRRRNIVDIKRWQLPKSLYGFNRYIWSNAQDIAIQDCLYRNIGHIKYLAFVDIDELIIPRIDANWAALIKHYDNDEISDFKFTTAFFQFTKEPVDYATENIGKPVISIYTNSTLDQFPRRSKCIVKPEYVFDMAVHKVNRKLRGKTETKWIRGDIALVHHYRYCVEGELSCGQRIKDTTATKYTEELMKRLRNYETLYYTA